MKHNYAKDMDAKKISKKSSKYLPLSYFFIASLISLIFKTMYTYDLNEPSSAFLWLFPVRWPTCLS